MCISSVINQLIFQPCPGSETQPLDAFWVKVTTRLDPVENPALGSPSWRISVGSLCLKLDPGAQNVSFSTGRNPISVFHPWISHGPTRFQGGHILSGTCWQSLCPSHAPAGMDTMHQGLRVRSSSLHCNASSTIIFVVNLITTKTCQIDAPRE